jgi:hypothetical protein
VCLQCGEAFLFFGKWRVFFLVIRCYAGFSNKEFVEEKTKGIKGEGRGGNAAAFAHKIK